MHQSMVNIQQVVGCCYKFQDKSSHEQEEKSGKMQKQPTEEKSPGKDGHK